MTLVGEAFGRAAANLLLSVATEKGLAELFEADHKKIEPWDLLPGGIRPIGIPVALPICVNVQSTASSERWTSYIGYYVYTEFSYEEIVSLGTEVDGPVEHGHTLKILFLVLGIFISGSLCATVLLLMRSNRIKTEEVDRLLVKRDGDGLFRVASPEEGDIELPGLRRRRRDSASSY